MTPEEFREVDAMRPRPWERQPHEGARRFAAFAAWLSQPSGSRSLLRAAEELGESFGVVSAYAQSPPEWELRAALYDAYFEHLHDHTAARVIRDAGETAGKRLARIRSRALDLAEASIDRHVELEEKTPRGTGIPVPVALRDAGALTSLAITITKDAAALGVESESPTTTETEIDWSVYTDEEIERIRELRELLERGRRGGE